MAGDPPPLDYAPRPARRRRLLRRAAIAGAVVVLAIAGWRWGPAAAKRARFLYCQRQCLGYAAPAERLVCEETISATGSDWHSPFVFEAPDPPELNALRAELPGWRRDAGPVLFLHELRTKSGQRCLVVLRRSPLAMRQSIDLPMSFTADLVEPATTHVPAIFRSMALGELLPVQNYGWATGSKPARLRLFAGQVDPADASHFTIVYELDGRRGTIDGTLKDPDPWMTASQGPRPMLELRTP